MQKTNNIRENQVHRATYTEERCALSSCIFMFFLFNTYRTSRNEIIRAVFFSLQPIFMPFSLIIAIGRVHSPQNAPVIVRHIKILFDKSSTLKYSKFTEE